MAPSEMKGIDLVARVHHNRKVDFRKGLMQGYVDQLVAYHRPQRQAWMSKQEYDAYPLAVLVRHLKYMVEQRGFRTWEITLATTLLNTNSYEAEELASLYRRPGLVDLHI
ncbi:hypothetical protein [Planctomycetes bacterium K23_9]|uniref:Uncharacterized protein n=1 Tax=Stieleria marina TaxID=1930275 RepID=A0A517NUY0_9BACT|nr:hypothetical protein K239x_29270 [Planctomycetes bacterium K23_9]